MQKHYKHHFYLIIMRMENVEARWLNGEFRAGKGDLVRYVHSGFDRNMETECVLRIKNGKVINTTTYHNYKKARLEDNRCTG